MAAGERIFARAHGTARILTLVAGAVYIVPFTRISWPDYALVAAWVVPYLVVAVLVFRIRLELTTTRVVVRGMLRTRVIPLNQVVDVRLRRVHHAPANSTRHIVDVIGPRGRASSTVFGRNGRQAVDRIKEERRRYRAARQAARTRSDG